MMWQHKDADKIREFLGIVDSGGQYRHFTKGMGLTRKELEEHTRNIYWYRKILAEVDAPKPAPKKVESARNASIKPTVTESGGDDPK